LAARAFASPAGALTEPVGDTCDTVQKQKTCRARRRFVVLTMREKIAARMACLSRR
jgi:hypothetical protein